MSVVAHKRDKVDDTKDEKKEEVDWINRLPVELLVHIIRRLPPEYLYTLHNWCAQAKQVLQYKAILKREQRNRWSDSLSLPLALCHINLLHLKCMVLNPEASPYWNLKTFNGRLFYSRYGGITEMSTTQSIREVENAQKFEDEEESAVDDEELIAVHVELYHNVRYTVDMKGWLYYYDLYFTPSAIIKLGSGITLDDFRDIDTDPIEQLVSSGEKLFALCENGNVGVWDKDIRVDTIFLSPDKRFMAVDRNKLYFICNNEWAEHIERAEYIVVDIDTHVSTTVPTLSASKFLDICVKDGDVYLYSELKNVDLHQAIITKRTPDGNERSLSADLLRYYGSLRKYTINMAIAGHYLHVTTSRNTLMIVDMRDFSLKHVDDMYFFSAVMGDDGSLYTNCSNRGPGVPLYRDVAETSRVLKFYW